VVVGPLIAVGYAIVQLWQRQVHGLDLALLFGFYVLTQIGVTIGYHRFLTHRGFRAPTWLKATFLVLGSMALEGPAITWASTHLEHHAHSDKEGDPHSPLDGLFHAHVGWMIDGFKHNVNRYGYWLLEDRLVVFVSRTFWLWTVLTFLIPFLIGGWSGLLWGGLVRVFLVHHVTWSVNSVCHVFGSRPFATGDESTNNWLVGLLAGGEGWHNNHHAFQRSAFHGLYWWQFDFSGLVIRALEALGVIDDVQRVSPEMMAKRLARQEAKLNKLQPVPVPVESGGGTD
jgi:stearoyl-CoA desaturase (delta-9 desaturase)